MPAFGLPVRIIAGLGADASVRGRGSGSMGGKNDTTCSLICKCWFKSDFSRFFCNYRKFVSFWRLQC